MMKGANENRYLLHSVLRGIQELIATTRPINHLVAVAGQHKASTSDAAHGAKQWSGEIDGSAAAPPK
jgi:hypothetical protein